jgi:hypothetical protein
MASQIGLRAKLRKRIMVKTRLTVIFNRTKNKAYELSFSAAGRIPAPGDESPLLIMPVVYRRPNGDVNSPEKRPSGLISELVTTARKPSNLESWLAAPRATCSKIWDGGNMSATKLSGSLALIDRRT